MPFVIKKYEANKYNFKNLGFIDKKFAYNVAPISNIFIFNVVSIFY